MEHNETIINHLAIKIVNLEIQVAALTAENTALRNQEAKEIKEGDASEQRKK